MSEHVSGPDERSYHMTPGEFRRQGRAVIDLIADYLERIEEFPVLSPVQPGEVRAALPGSPPERGEPLADMLADVERVILPGLTHWQSPSFFGFFPANSSGPSVLGELLSAGLGVQGMLWATSPACTELETLVLDWLAELLALPAGFRSDSPAGGAVIQDSASSAVLCALVAARERATRGLVGTAGGAAAGQLTTYCSAEAHSSVEKAVRIAGVGTDNLRRVAVDDRLALDPAALEAALATDVAAGATPVLVVATVGTTGTTAIDPLPAVAAVCDRYAVWLHVDAAMSGTAALCPEFRWIHEGLDRADSYSVNPHKWMFTNFDCDAFYVADRAALVSALSILPEYLRNAATESGAVIDYRDWQVPLGRRFRALKLWFVLRHYGAGGLRHHVREHVAIAQKLAGWVRADSRFELAAPVPLNLVCFRHVDGDVATERVMAEVNGSGAAYLSSTRVCGRLVIRVSVGGTLTRAAHVKAAWGRLQQAADGL